MSKIKYDLRLECILQVPSELERKSVTNRILFNKNTGTNPPSDKK